MWRTHQSAPLMPEPIANDNCTASGCAALVDIRCSNAHSGDFFHVVVDCLLPNLATIDRAAGYGAASRSTHCVVGAGYRPFVEVLFEAALAQKNLGVREHCDELTQPRPLTRSASATLAAPGNKALLRRLLLASSLQPTAPVEPTVILIERDATRRFENADAVAAALAAARGLSPAAVRRFTGHDAGGDEPLRRRRRRRRIPRRRHVNTLFTTRRDPGDRVVDALAHDARRRPALALRVGPHTYGEGAAALPVALKRARDRAVEGGRRAAVAHPLAPPRRPSRRQQPEHRRAQRLGDPRAQFRVPGPRPLREGPAGEPGARARPPRRRPRRLVAARRARPRGGDGGLGSGESPPGFVWDGAAWAAPTPEEALSLAVLGVSG